MGFVRERFFEFFEADEWEKKSRPTSEAALGRDCLSSQAKFSCDISGLPPVRPAYRFWEIRARRTCKYYRPNPLHYGSLLQVEAPRESGYSAFLTAAATTSG